MQQRRDLPPPPALEALQAEGPVAVFLDFDGTLVDIAQTPGGIEVPDALGDDLAALSHRLGGRLALVSGRAIDNLEQHLGPLKVAGAGSHGIDRRLADGTLLDEAAQALPPEAARDLADFAARTGFDLESKPHGSALHYRANPALEDEGLAFAADLAERHSLTVKRGKCVIELVRPGADKGGAVRAFMAHEHFAGARPVFIGDDITDEDGFAAVQDLGGMGILVGDREETSAMYQLAGPGEVFAWLGM